MKKRFLRTMIIMASMMSTFHVVPVRGQEYTKSITINAIGQAEKEYKKKNKEYTRYSKVQLNIRNKPNTDSKIVGTLRYNQKVKIKKYNKKWVIYVKDGKEIGYLRKKYLGKKKCKSTKYTIPEYSGYKSWMNYQAITDTSSPQWKLQQQSYTGDYGIRMVDGRYCVAIGFAFDPKIGQYFDLKLENGNVIPCVISDEKRVSDTDEDNIFTTHNGCCTEFVVDIDSLYRTAATMGDMSEVEGWDSPVDVIEIYDKYVEEYE